MGLEARGWQLEVHGWQYVTRMEIDGTEASVWIKGDLRVLVSRDPEQRKGSVVYRWHLSISCEHRYPTWEEMKDARYCLLPDNVYMAQILPPQSEYVDIHPNCFHWYEMEP